MSDVPSAVPAVERRRRPRRAKHHEAHVHWKHIAVYVPIVVLVTLLGGLAIWSFIEKQSLVIVPQPIPRVTLETADPNARLTASWVRLLHTAGVEATVVSSAAARDQLIVRCGRGVAYPAVPGRGAPGDALELSAAPSPILARLTPKGEIPARAAPAALLDEKPGMRIDMRWRNSARAAVMHMEEPEARVLWIGFDPDAVAANPALLLMLRTSVRWLAGQPISSGRSDQFAFSVEPLRDRRSFAVTMMNRGDGRIDKPSVQLWLPPGVSQVALGGDWLMRRGASLTRQEDTWVVSLPSLGRREERVLKLTAR